MLGVAMIDYYDIYEKWVFFSNSKFFGADSLIYVENPLSGNIALQQEALQ